MRSPRPLAKHAPACRANDECAGGLLSKVARLRGPRLHLRAWPPATWCWPSSPPPRFRACPPAGPELRCRPPVRLARTDSAGPTWKRFPDRGERDRRAWLGPRESRTWIEMAPRALRSPSRASRRPSPATGPRLARRSRSLCNFAHAASARRNVWNVLTRSCGEECELEILTRIDGKRCREIRVP
jgi:hypothetical protein